MELNVVNEYFGIQSAKVKNNITYQCNLQCQNWTEPTTFRVIYYQVYLIYFIFNFSHLNPIQLKNLKTNRT